MEIIFGIILLIIGFKLRSYFEKVLMVSELEKPPAFRGKSHLEHIGFLITYGAIILGIYLILSNI